MCDDQAYVQDTLHDDIRTEGLGLGMMFLVQLDHQGEFDRLWTYAKENLRVDSGPNAGYFNSSCDTPDGDTVPCLDPFGLEQFVTALLFARTRWEDTPSGIDYEQEAAALFDLMQHKQDQNGGIVDGVTNTFDFHAHLPYDLPNLASKNYTRPAVAIPAYYELWAQATSDPFWKHAAEAARGYLDRAAHPATGLLPVRAYFDGEPVTDWNVFEPEGYRAELNIALDQIWFGDPRDMDESNKLLLFFSTAGIDAYGASYPLEGGACIKCDREPALIAANGAIAIAASPNLRGRADFIQAVWDSKLLTGTPRYYGGLMQLGALLVLSGQFRVY
jgi:oligosaccharide reducing-end xylanase